MLLSFNHENNIKIGEWYDAELSSQHDSRNAPPILNKYYFIMIGDTEYAVPKTKFYTEQQWREQQLNKIL